jgi:hypothetical protein
MDKKMGLIGRVPQLTEVKRLAIQRSMDQSAPEVVSSIGQQEDIIKGPSKSKVLRFTRIE